MTKIIDIIHKNDCVYIAAPETCQLHHFIINELCYHFERLAGLKVEITDSNALIKFQLVSGMEPDAFKCREEDGVLFISANNQRGLYYGMMAFFEKLGCRHFAPGEENSVIPHLKCIQLPYKWHIEEKPSLRWRGYHICSSGLDHDGKMIWHYDHDTALFMIRNRLNFKPIHNDEYDKITPLLDSMLLSSLAFGHSYSEWIPNSEFAVHPEFFPLIGGERVPEGQLCLSNEKLQELIVKRIVEYLRSHPKLETISLAPNDGYGFCECESCLKLDSELDRSTNAINHRHHYFTAQIAEKVRKFCPDNLISTISYSNYKDPGEDIPYQSNLAISICVEVESLIENQLDPPVSPTRPDISKRIKKWCKKAKNVFWSEYLLSYGGTFPRPYAHRLADTVKYLVESNVSGFKTEVSAGRSPAWQSAAFFMYVVSRLLYDASLDVDSLLRDFCEKFYGPGSGGALEYYQLTDKIINLRKRDLSKIRFDLISELYSDNDIIELEKSLDKAISRTSDEPYYSRIIVLQKQFKLIVCSRQSLIEASIEDLPQKIMQSKDAGNWEYMEKLPLIQLRQRTNCSRYEPENSFALAYDKQKIYLYFKLGEPDMTELHKNNKALDLISGVCTLSNVDCFLSPSPETGVYYQIMINSKGECYSARCHNKTWDSGYDLKPEIHRRFFQNHWELLVGIAFKQLETDVPLPGKQWKTSFNRHLGRFSDAEGLLGGWPRGGVWHDIAKSGIIYFHND